MKNIIIVASSPEDPSSIIHLTPYTAMTIAEYFRDLGRDTLIVLDDLSTHAKFYREISLIAKRFPGRNSYPGDIFHTHSKLLERAGNFVHEKGEVSITCLPVVETTQGDLSGYIQTNIMSMTDGHIFFDSDLFSKGRRPAINPFLSVTRVGHQAQSQLRREINRELISFLTLFEKVQNYVHFGAELSESIKTTLSTGEQIMNLFDQPLYRTNPPNFQVFLFCTLWTGFWSQKSLSEMRQDIEKLTTAFDASKELQKEINE
ncbi:MAG: F0F1 ATP synthase subunit alpha, partial [Patescibacteria group bacterium]|nr:F0F1 ATP synthase subunit alpha [Patescibacteria group bacterium]